jgi:flagellar basal body-associated protein FliL
MENRNKKKILIGILIALILMNLAALGTFVYQKYLSEPKKEQNWDKDKNPQERVKHFVRRELNLTDAQFENYCRFKDTNIKNSDEIWNHLVRLRQSALLEITSENPDTVRLSELSDSIGIYHKRMQKEMVRHFLSVKKTLKKDQIPKFNEMILNMEKREWRRHGRSRDDSEKQGQRNRYGNK